MPAKSGVSGSIILVIPNVMCVALWSPPLDQIGNSVTNSPISRSVLSDNSRLGNECKLIDSIVMSETIVGNNCTIIESIIGEHVIIGNDCQISGSVIGDDVRLKDGTELRDSKISSHQQNAQDK